MQGKKRFLQNSAVVTLALAASVVAIDVNTNWFKKKTESSQARERCFGIVRAGKNDCATRKHSCAALAEQNNDPTEWVMVPNGLCRKISGGVGD